MGEWVLKGLEPFQNMQFSLSSSEDRVRELIGSYIRTSEYVNSTAPDLPMDIVPVKLDEANGQVTVGGMHEVVIGREVHSLHSEQEYALIMERLPETYDNIVANGEGGEVRESLISLFDLVGRIHRRNRNETACNLSVRSYASIAEHLRKKDVYVYAGALIEKHLHNEAWNNGELKRNFSDTLARPELGRERREQLQALSDIDSDWNTFQHEVFAKGSPYWNYFCSTKSEDCGPTQGDLKLKNIGKRQNGTIVIFEPIDRIN